MTRFARAKGSKSSNERIPEQATSWSEMKQQLEDSKKRSEDEKLEKQVRAKRTENYNKFLKDVEEDKAKKVKWAPINGNSDDEAPEETTSKVEVPDVKVKKPKAKKRKLNIIVEQEDKVIEIKKPKVDIEKKPQKSGKKTPNLVENGIKNADNVKVQQKPNKMKNKKQNDVKGDGKNIPSAKEKTPKKGSKKVKPEPKPKKDRSEMTELELKKVDKKKQKRLKQLEKKKLKKEQAKAAKPTETNTETAEKAPVKVVKPPKTPKPKLSKESKPPKRKPVQTSMIVNGREIPIAYVDGFPVRKDDAERIQQLRRQMISKGLPRSEIQAALKLERRKAEKSFARERKKVCFQCRKSGHNLSECPELGNQLEAGSGICFKCGSTEHTHFECKVVKTQDFKYAQCFICKEQGHIARQCPDNARGLYPKGGACKVCGDVTHLKKDCPKFQEGQEMEMDKVRAEVMTNNGNPEDGGGDRKPVFQGEKAQNKIIKF